MAFPNEREVIVVKRNKAKAELQTQRSGWFQILFGPVDRLDAFMFWGAQDNLKLDTPEGAIFGKVMAAFLQGHLKPQQFVGTPQTLVAGGVSLEPPTPEFDDPEDALRWRALLSVDASLAALLEKYQECYETAEKVEKAFGLADSGYVNGVRQHEYSVAAFREMGARQEGVLVDLLKELREVTHQAVAQWNNLLFLLPDAPNDILKISNWCSSRGVDSEVMSRVVGNGMYQFTNFGLTRKSFWAENARVIAVSNGAGQ